MLDGNRELLSIIEYVVDQHHQHHHLFHHLVDNHLLQKKYFTIFFLMQENRGVHGVVLINNEGIPLKTTMVMILFYTITIIRMISIARIMNAEIVVPNC